MTLLSSLLLVATMVTMLTPTPVTEQGPTNPTVASPRGSFDLIKGWLNKAAEQVPEEHYGMTDAHANEVVKFFIAGTHTRLGVLAFNTAHDFEHYGNIVTYMRIKGMVPPSSGGGM